jgi:hypothetical protein
MSPGEDDLLAFGRVEDHVRRMELGRVVGEARHFDLALAQEPVAALPLIDSAAPPGEQTRANWSE